MANNMSQVAEVEVTNIEETTAAKYVCPLTIFQSGTRVTRDTCPMRVHDLTTVLCSIQFISFEFSNVSQNQSWQPLMLNCRYPLAQHLRRGAALCLRENLQLGTLAQKWVGKRSAYGTADGSIVPKLDRARGQAK